VTPKGFHDATRDPDRIRKLLTAGSEPNYGLVCPPGVFAWDVDGPDWQDQLARLAEQYGPLPLTLTTQTANGVHMFWRWPDDLPIPAGEMFGWVTRWGAGRGAGYVIGPRSVHQSGAVYAPVAGAGLTVASLPTSWANGALRGSVGPTGHAGPIRVGGTGYQLPDSVGEGQRYEAIVAYTAHLYNRGLQPPEMWDLVVGQLAPRFRVPLSADDLRARFDRATADMAARLGPPIGRGAAGAQHKTGGGDDAGGEDWGWLPLDEAGGFPIAPADVAFGGLLGQLVDAMAQGNDASRVALMGSAVAFAGALVPGAGYWAGRLQTTSPYVCLVGESGVGRKGTAMLRTFDVFAHVLERDIVARTVLDGVASGEGLISAMAGTQAKYPAQRTAHLLFEEEFARVLAIRGREGSTLDTTLRQMFDGGPASNHRADARKVVNPPYWLPALVAITPAELRDRLEGTALTSGSGNRWLYLPVTKRTGDVAQDEGFGPADVVTLELQRALMEAAGPARAHGADATKVPADVSSTLREYGDWLASVSVGLAGDLSRRLPVLALRVALVHAAVERASAVSRAQLDRALALTEYARAGLGWVFGATAGSPDARHLLRQLQAAGGRMSRNMATQRVLRDQAKLTAASDELLRLGLARTEKVLTPGRARLDLVATYTSADTDGGFRAYVQTPRARTRRDGPSDDSDDDSLHGLHGSPRPSTDQAAHKVHESRTDGADKGTDGDTGQTGGSNLGVTPDGVLWCRDWRGHQLQHRDVATGSPWCEVCVAEFGR
jgi:hypothetical protein